MSVTHAGLDLEAGEARATGGAAGASLEGAAPPPPCAHTLLHSHTEPPLDVPQPSQLVLWAVGSERQQCSCPPWAPCKGCASSSSSPAPFLSFLTAPAPALWARPAPGMWSPGWGAVRFPGDLPKQSCPHLAPSCLPAQTCRKGELVSRVGALTIRSPLVWEATVLTPACLACETEV